MLESADGFRDSLTRQCCGIGLGGGGAAVGAPPRPDVPVAAGGAPDGGGGGVKMPAGTTSAPRIVTCGVESAVKLSHPVAALTIRTRPKASIGISFRSAGAAAPSGEGYTPEGVNREIDAILIGTPARWHKTMTLNAV